MKALDILHQAIEKLTMLTGGTVTYLPDPQHPGKKEIDATVELTFGTRNTVFIIEVRNELRINHIPAVQKLKTETVQEFLLVCQYIPMPLKAQLRELKINYLEAAGNCYIETAEIFLYINDQQVTATRLPAEGKLWKMAGLKFLFAILRHPDLLNGPYRKIADEAGIALGNIGGYLEELRKEGFLRDGIINNTKGFFIEQNTRLMERWAEAYEANLRPREWIGNFRFMDQNNIKNWRELKTVDFKWGGENAAALMTGFLHPERFTIYITGNRVDMMKKLKLVPDPNGPVEMLQQFWRDEENDNTQATVPPLLAFAELITKYDSRDREAAERIKAKYLD
ncbi:type IV toxin-antitoxin system AbiEi family antitoxin [Mucilaginibacter gynuensis]